MAKGSQFTQLKKELLKAGVTNPPEKSRRRRRAQDEDKDRVKKAQRLNEIHQKFNPFDLKTTRLKHDVGGRRLKGVTGRPAQSKQAGLEQRRKALLKEVKARNRAGGFVDRRFGESDPTMTPEERMLERFTRERQRASKGVMFNLEEEAELTHYGQSLSNLDDFDYTGLLADEDEDGELSGQIDSSTVKQAHFGGPNFGDGNDDDELSEPDRKKSKAEVMAEVVAKSKEHKLQRQIEREQNDNTRRQLDHELGTIRSLLLAADPITASLERANGLAAGMSAERDQEYDQFVRELVFDKRARPKDRLKTEEELAFEEKHKLEKAERRRIRRMNGETDIDSSEDDSVGRMRKRRQSGDDLEDDFTINDWSGLGAGLEDGPNTSEDDESGVSTDEDEAKDSAQSTLRQDSVRNEERTGQSAGLNTEELPFTFECPSSHDTFLEILSGVVDEDVPVVVQRIRSLHHPSLGVDNKTKLQNFTGVLVDHILYAASSPAPKLQVISSLIPHIFALAKKYPIQAAEHFVTKLSLMSRNLKRGLSQGAGYRDAKTWPGFPELVLMRTIGLIWPTSDMNHPVISPTRILMGSYLALCRTRSMSDLTSGIFLCSLFLQFENRSRRLVPEAVNYLVNAVVLLCPHGFKSSSSLPRLVFSPDFSPTLHERLRIDEKKAQGLAMKTPRIDTLFSTPDHMEQAKVDLLGLAIELLGQFAQIARDADGFIEMFEPALVVLEHATVERLTKSLQTHIESIRNSISRLLRFSREARRSLHLQAHKPISIPSYIPKFETTTSTFLRARDPDHERNQVAKLRRQYKQERKGAIRELRKDARFLSSVEQEKQREKDEMYKASLKRVFGSIESERAEEKAMERAKKREKRRSGRK